MPAQAAPPPRLRERYEQEILPALTEKFGYSTPMQAPRLQKITLNMGLGEAKQNAKMLRSRAGAAGDDRRPAAERSPRPQVDRLLQGARGNAGRRLGHPAPGPHVGVPRPPLTSIAVPRIRDFRGLNPRSFDGRGNYSMGVKEQLIFPEIDYDSIDEVRGLDMTITTTREDR